jgi:hypothetical protein
VTAAVAVTASDRTASAAVRAAGGHGGEELGWLDARHRVLHATLVVGVALTLLTESLSLFGALNARGVVAGWGLLACVGLAVLLRRGSRHRPRGWRWDLGSASVGRLATLVAVAAILAATALVALAAQANNWDSMSYHMGRVSQWSARESVANYPTHITRQLLYPPWAEYAVTHLYLLAGGDRLVNLVQWTSFAICVLGASLLAAELGAGARGQVAAAALAASVPMAILQASSTQNDLVAALWMTCIAAAVLTYARRTAWWSAPWFGAAVGLAVLTKSSTWLYVVPFAIWFAALAWRHERWACWRPVVVAGVCVGLLNLGYGIRTLTLVAASDIAPAALKTMLPPAPEPTTEAPQVAPGVRMDRLDQGAYVNQRYGPGPLLSNVLRGATLHLATPFDGLNAVIEGAVVGIHYLLGLDPNDARTTYGTRTYRVSALSLHEDSAGNLLHVILALTCVGIFLCHRPLAGRNEAWMLACLVGGTLLFCLVLKWQPWHSRLHLPLFLLAAPFVAVQLDRWLQPRLVATIVGLALLAAAPAVVANQPRPLVGERSVLSTPRLDQLFVNRPELRDPYVGAAAFLATRGCRSPGLILGGNEWEYPLWVLLRTQPGPMPHVEHILVRNVSRRLAVDPAGTPRPCALVAVAEQLGDAVSWRGASYVSRWTSGPVQVLVQE